MAALRSLKRVSGIVVLFALLAVGCTAQEATPEAEAIPAAQSDFGNVVSASGKVVPVRRAEMSFENGGQLLSLVPEGSTVEAGEPLARLDTSDLEQAVAEAQAALDTAEAQLAQAQVGSRVEDIAAAEGAVMIAEGNVAAANGRLEQIKVNTGLAVEAAQASLAQAQGVLEAAEADLARAQAELGRIRAGTRPEEIAIYQARLAQAEAELRLPANVHDDLIDKEVGGVPEEQARFRMEAAQGARDAAAATLALAQAGPAAGEVAAAIAAVNAARAQVTIAEAGVQLAEATLAQAEASQSDVEIAEAQLQITRGQLAQAEAERDKITAGATTEEIAVLESQVAQARAALSQAESMLAKATLLAPFAGTVGTVYLQEGEVVSSGTPVLALGDVSSLWVETTDLNEVDAAQVGVGSPVNLTFDALPELSLDGQIARLAPMAADGQGGTNFTAIIEMDSLPESLRWGMTAFVDIELE